MIKLDKVVEIDSIPVFVVYNNAGSDIFHAL